MSVFAHDVPISFGDCDPAGIVFYPNFFAWMDATFHAYLRARAGGHGSLCRELGAQGLGLMEATIGFRSPATDGDRLVFTITGITWSARTFALTYAAHIGDRLVLEGREVRGMFVRTDGRITAADVAPLKTRIG